MRLPNILVLNCDGACPGYYYAERGRTLPARKYVLRRAAANGSTPHLRSGVECHVWHLCAWIGETRRMILRPALSCLGAHDSEQSREDPSRKHVRAHSLHDVLQAFTLVPEHPFPCRSPTMERDQYASGATQSLTQCQAFASSSWRWESDSVPSVRKQA